MRDDAGEVVDALAPRRGASKRICIGQDAADDVDVGKPPEVRPRAHQEPDRIAFTDECVDEMASEEARAAGDERLHRQVIGT